MDYIGIIAFSIVLVWVLSKIASGKKVSIRKKDKTLWFIEKLDAINIIAYIMVFIFVRDLLLLQTILFFFFSFIFWIMKKIIMSD